MRRVATVLSAAAMVLFVASVFAQGKDLVGKWTPDAEKNAAANAGGGGGGARGGGGGGGRGGGGDIEIAVDGKVVTITTTGQNGPTPVKYTADGTTETTVQGRGGEQKATAKFDGAKLVITSGGQPTTWYIEGSNLVRERTTQNGTQKTYFKKAS